MLRSLASSQADCLNAFSCLGCLPVENKCFDGTVLVLLSIQVALDFDFGDHYLVIGVEIDRD